MGEDNSPSMAAMCLWIGGFSSHFLVCSPMKREPELEKGRREGWQVKYPFLKCCVISQLDVTAWWCSQQVVDRLGQGYAVR